MWPEKSKSNLFVLFPHTFTFGNDNETVQECDWFLAFENLLIGFIFSKEKATQGLFFLSLPYANIFKQNNIEDYRCWAVVTGKLLNLGFNVLSIESQVEETGIIGPGAEG